MIIGTGSAPRARVRLVLALAAAVGLGLGAAGRAAAAPNLTFTLTPQAGDGRISYAGGSAPVVGDGLRVASVKGLDTPSHADKTFSLDAGTLQFTTGAFSGLSQSNTEHDFAAGGMLKLVGGIADLGIKPGSTLLTGSFSNNSFVRSLGAGELRLQGGAFVNVVDPTLAAYFGLPTGGAMYLGGLGTLFSAPTTPAGGFASSGLTSGSLTTQPVPEPTTLAVFAALAAAAAAGAYRRRRAA